MNIKDLKKGNWIEKNSSTVLPTITWNYVLYNGSNVGIGIFDEKSNTAISAIVLFDNNKHVLNELVSEHPLDKGAKTHLEKLFNHYFS